MQDISAAIGFTHITVKNIVRELQEHGLVKITANPTDARSKHVVLTAKGKTLYGKLEPIWQSISKALEQLMTSGHPDIINIISNIEEGIEKKALPDRIRDVDNYNPVLVVDFKPSLKKQFYELAGNWLFKMLNGKLEKEDEFALKNQVVGCVALKRLSEDKFEFCKLFIDPEVRKLGIATKLIERCITRCKENNASELWLQTTNELKEAHKLYYKLGFEDKKTPKEMDVLKRTEKIMSLRLS